MRRSSLRTSFGGRSCLQGLIIDDFFSVSIEDDTDSRQVPLAEKRLRVAQQAYKEEGLLGSEEKNVISEECSKVAGAELDGSAFTRKLGLCTLAAPASKRLGLSFLSLQLASLRATTDSLHACLLGGWTSCLMYRRALMSILDRVHSFADMSLVDQNNPKVLKMPRLVAQEFVLLGILAPFMCADLAAPISTSVYASDASDLEVGEDLARGLWRTGRKKGGYTRLLSREQALLAKIDFQWEEEVPEEKIEHPSKPLAMRYHFIEICGGAGKITKYADKEGLVVGPVIEFDRSPAFDLCLLQLLSWLCFMVEGAAWTVSSWPLLVLLTTFSPAAFPSLRSYTRPRGFNPTERRTLLGTTLAWPLCWLRQGRG